MTIFDDVVFTAAVIGFWYSDSHCLIVFVTFTFCDFHFDKDGNITAWDHILIF